MQYVLSPVGMVLAVLLAGVVPCQDAGAQSTFERRTVFVRLGTGVSFYQGDLSSVNWQKRMFGYPAVRGEIGYQFTPSFSALVGYNAADHPRVGKPGFWYSKHYWEDGFVESRDPIYTTTWRFTAQLQFQYAFLPSARFSPYFRLGVHGTHGGRMTGHAGVNKPSLGPSVGLGGLLTVSDRLGFFIGANASATFPDQALDGFTDYTISDRRAFDILGFAGVGMRWRLTSSFEPVRDVRIHGPSELELGEEGYFTADYPDTPTRPLTYEWSFGDGAEAAGRSVAHRYTREDTFVVMLTASNDGSSQTAALEVTVNREQPQQAAPALSSIAQVDSVFPPVPIDTLRTHGGDSDSLQRSVGRTNCTEVLASAEEHYHQQRFDAAVEMVRSCIGDETPEELRIQSYRLISRAHIIRGAYGEAREAVLRLLGIDPTYAPDPVQDPPTYVALVNIVRHQLGLR